MAGNFSFAPTEAQISSTQSYQNHFEITITTTAEEGVKDEVIKFGF